jgi:uncharacterized protein (TIGR02117 family)
MIFYFIKIFLKVIFTYGIIALFLGSIPVNRNFRQSGDGTNVFIISNGIHTDIVLPVKSRGDRWKRFFEQSKLYPGFASVKYIAFGWGNREFYLNTPEWKDLTPRIALNALILKREAAMHVTFIDFNITEGKSAKKIQLSPEQIERLSWIIQSSFKMDKNGCPMIINSPGYSDNDLFFEARGRFSIFRTCNEWTNECLKKAGIKCGAWTPFDFLVLHNLSGLTK